MNSETIFYNEHGRIRSGWRFAAFLLSFFLVAAFLLTAATAFLMALPTGFSPYGIGSFVMQFSISLAVVLFFGWLYGKIFEDLPFRALGFWVTPGWLKNLVWGLIIGAASLALTALIAYLFGGLRFQINDTAGTAALLLTLGTTLGIFILGAAFEEAFLRGYSLQTFSRAGLALFGTILTSMIFATMHNGNPGATALSWLNTFLAGVWLAVAYFKTRDLWFPFGVHLAWNWFQGSIFGISVSGLDKLAPAPLMRATDAGPVWLTGGNYGLEGGIACTAALLVSTAAIWFAPFLKPDQELLALTSEEGGRRKMEGKR